MPSELRLCWGGSVIQNIFLVAARVLAKGNGKKRASLEAGSAGWLAALSLTKKKKKPTRLATGPEARVWIDLPPGSFQDVEILQEKLATAAAGGRERGVGREARAEAERVVSELRAHAWRGISGQREVLLDWHSSTGTERREKRSRSAQQKPIIPVAQAGC